MSPATNGKTAYATVRELYAVKDALLAEMKAMELRLALRIDAANEHHDGIHDSMRAAADTRHRRIDDFISAEDTAAAVDAGRSTAFRQIAGALRTVNEFRWLLAMIVATLFWATGTLHVTF